VIPYRFEVDHLCKVKHCVNPDHLEAVTPKENVHRSDNTAGLNFRKKVCMRGHNDWRVDKKGRFCVTCKNEWERNHRRWKTMNQQ
jgi:hypothetical protein